MYCSNSILSSLFKYFWASVILVKPYLDCFCAIRLAILMPCSLAAIAVMTLPILSMLLNKNRDASFTLFKFTLVPDWLATFKAFSYISCTLPSLVFISNPKSCRIFPYFLFASVPGFIASLALRIPFIVALNPSTGTTFIPTILNCNPAVAKLNPRAANEPKDVIIPDSLRNEDDPGVILKCANALPTPGILDILATEFLRKPSKSLSTLSGLPKK